MDITDTLAPKSDQLDAIELIDNPRSFTVTKVTKGNAEQPVNVHLADFPRVWRPSKGMRRVLAACWSTDASTWAGRHVRLYNDETVTFGPEVTGGIRISHLSHIEKRRTIPLPIKRGKVAQFVVEPFSDVDLQILDLRAEWRSASADRKAQIQAEVARLSGGAQ